MTQELKPVTADELRQIPEKIKQLEHNRYVDRIVKKVYTKVLQQAENKLNKRKYYILSAENDFDISEFTIFLKRYHNLIIQKLNPLFPGCKITYSDSPSTRGLFVLCVDWS